MPARSCCQSSFPLVLWYQLLPPLNGWGGRCLVALLTVVLLRQLLPLSGYLPVQLWAPALYQDNVPLQLVLVVLLVLPEQALASEQALRLAVKKQYAVCGQQSLAVLPG
jgi:hypothetical protein